jgi:hypothetical protein
MKEMLLDIREGGKRRKLDRNKNKEVETKNFVVTKEIKSRKIPFLRFA